MSNLSATLRKTTEQMASTCSVPMDLWCEHSSAVLKAADQIERSNLTAEEAWQDLIETSDVTSPAEYPNHALITFEQLRDYMSSASQPTD